MLVAALQRCFRESNLKDSLRCEFKNRVRQPGVSLCVPAYEIESLGRRAYADMPPAIQSERASTSLSKLLLLINYVCTCSSVIQRPLGRHWIAPLSGSLQSMPRYHHHRSPLQLCPILRTRDQRGWTNSFVQHRSRQLSCQGTKLSAALLCVGAVASRATYSITAMWWVDSREMGQGPCSLETTDPFCPLMPTSSMGG